MPSAELVQTDSADKISNKVNAPIQDDYGISEGAISASPSTNSPPPVQVKSTEPLPAIEEALTKINASVLTVLKEKFNGTPSELRNLDTKDRIF